MGDLAAIDALVERTVDEFGGVDIVINNAANALSQPIGEITPDAWSKSFAVNQQGPVFLVQSALPHLRLSQHAVVLNIVSAGAFIFSPTMSMYSAAKAAMVSFTRSMAAEFASAGIRVNALAPGRSTPTWCGVIRRNSRPRWPAKRYSTGSQPSTK